jgi:hypothetical protein
MDTTPFPTRPFDVIALTAQEFMLDLDMDRSPSLDAICARFLHDTNRAVVWLIRFNALNVWRAHADTARWLAASAGTDEDVCEVAAGFSLNDHWEFENGAFSAAVSQAAQKRTGPLLG